MISKRCLFRAAAASALLQVGSLAASGGEWEPVPSGIEARAIAELAENAVRSDRTYLSAEMTVVSPRLLTPRTVAFESWDDRPGRRSFILVSEPPKDADTTFLKLDPNLWMYVPRVERTMRLPPSMMLQSWMGSDFTNDDLVKDSSQLDDYDHILLGVDPSPQGHAGLRAYVLEYRPHEHAPVVWGRIVAWVEVEHGTPLLQEYYDEDEVKLRVMGFGDVRERDGRHYPHEWTMTALDKEGHSTRIRILEVRFDAEISDSVFTKRNLTRRR